MQTRYRHIYFVVAEEKPKTKVWSCRNNKTGFELGRVHWYGPWRRYCVHFCDDAEFDSGCLGDIIDFMDQLNKAHKDDGS